MISLAGPLLDYVEGERDVQLLTETAIVHFAGDSSSGKTTLARLAQSVFGDPDVAIDYEASDRGIAEAAYARNNLALTIDDAENAGDSNEQALATMLRHARQCPRGRSKAISSRSRRADLAELVWSCFGISSGPETVAELAAKTRRPRRGDRVRIFDIKLPPREKSGIFGSRETATREPAGNSASLVAQLEASIQKCHGYLFDAWIQYLLDHDAADRIIKLVDRFVEAVACGADGLERRFAKKFAVFYAAGQVGVDSGLLPWPKDWPMRAVRHCYENSVRQRDPERAATTKAIRQFVKSLNSPTLFPVFVVKHGRHLDWADEQIGLRLKSRGRTETFIAKGRLDLIDPDGCGHFDVFNRLCEMKAIQHGKYEEASRQLRVRRPSGKIVKVRLWRLDVERLINN